MAYPDPYSHTRPQQPHRPVSYNSEADYGEAPLQYPTYDASAAGGVVPVQGGPRPLSVGVAATPYTSYDVRDEKSFARNSQPGGAGLGDDRPMSQWTIPPPPKSTGILRMWRKENRASWVKVGGGARGRVRARVQARADNSNAHPPGRWIPNILPTLLMLFPHFHLLANLGDPHDPACEIVMFDHPLAVRFLTPGGALPLPPSGFDHPTSTSPPSPFHPPTRSP